LIKAYRIIEKLIDRYDYGGALELLGEEDLMGSVPAILVDSCRYAINFDFETAFKILGELSVQEREEKTIKELSKNLRELIDGDPNAIFSELLENIKFQVVNEQFIDFLGRVYRCKEAIFKYIFVKKHLNLNSFSFHIEVMQKRNILKILNKKYKIFNSNLVYSISTYIQRNLREESKYMEITRILNAPKMDELIELRNGSIVGHGFTGVSIDDIYRVYGNPYNVLDDFRECLLKLDIRLNRYKYSIINDFIKDELRKIHFQNQPVNLVEELNYE